MKITVLNGTQKHGITYRLKELFLERFRQDASITEYELPKDCPAFCAGCTSCFLKGEQNCKDAAYIQVIERSLLKADLIVMASPAYVFHATGAMKAFLDHMGYRWMPHRPMPEMFGKRAVILTQCLGAGAKTAAKDMKHSLSWWGISKIGVFQKRLFGDIVWEKLSEKRRKRLTKEVRALSERFSRIRYEKPARTKASVKLKFAFCRIMQRILHKNDPEYLDGAYWRKRAGWETRGRGKDAYNVIC